MNNNNRNNCPKNTQQKTAPKNPKSHTTQLLGLDQRMNNGYINLPPNRRSIPTNSNLRHNQTATNTGRYVVQDANHRNFNQEAPNRSSNDAPTSLSNLAQLSGITLLPVSNQRHVSSNTAKNQHVFSAQALQQFRRTDFSDERLSSNTQRQELELDCQRRGANPGSVNYGASNSRMKSSYNVSATPSAQLLNQSLPTNGGKLPPYADATRRNVQKSQRNNRVNKHPNAVDNRARVNKVSDQTDPHYDFNQKPLLLNSDIQLIPVSDNYRANDTADSTLQHVDASLSASGSDSELGMTNESLLQLMAVFSNPALTITPIDSRGNVSYVDDGNINDSVGEATISAAALPVDNTLHDDIIYNPSDYESANQNVNSRAKFNNRMPKSAANLRMIYSHDSSQQNSFIDVQSNKRLNNQSESGLDDKYGQATNSPARSGQLDFEVADYPITDPLDEVDGSLNAKNYEMISDSIRDLIMEKCNRNSSAPPTISVQLIRELASQAKDTSQWIESKLIKTELQTLQDRGSRRSPIKELGKAIKLPEVTNLVYINEQALIVKQSKQQLKTSQHRLFEPSTERPYRLDQKSEPKTKAIFVETLESNRQTYLSERHDMVESMRPTKRQKLDHNQITEEQGSSSEQMKGPISKIALTVERWKRIDAATTDHSSERMQPSVPDFDDLGYLNFYDYDDTSKILNRNRTVSIQLPSEDGITSEKRDFMNRIGLVTRYQRSKLLLDDCEKKLRVYSALALESKVPVSDDAKRFVRMINQTDGTDIQLRVDTDIKRNDLPLIEGLNRNSSRTKMNYMGILGLDKRSKRTTLYKMGKISESLNLIQEPNQQSQQRSQLLKQQQQQCSYHDQLQSQQQQRQLQQVQQQPKQVELNQRLKHQQSRQHHNDLSNKKKPMTNDNQSSKRETSKLASQDVECSIIPMLFGFDNISRPPLSRIAVSCREAMNKPSKQDYMKSLGLISS